MLVGGRGSPFIVRAASFDIDVRIGADLGDERISVTQAGVYPPESQSHPMSSTTWSVRTAKVIADEVVASVVVRLMMALNDIAMANEGLGEWTVTQEPRKLARQNGGR